MSRPRNPDLQRLDDETNASLTAAEETLSIAIETEKQGISTLSELHDQGVQIKRIQNNVDQLIEDEDMAKRKVNRLGSLFGCFKNACLPRPKRHHPNTRPATETQVSAHDAPVPDGNANEIEQLDPANRQKVKKTDTVLDEVLDHVENLKTIAEHMNTEINQQNKDLDTLTETTEKANDNLDQLNHGVRRML